jgi:hypothetical protein
MHARSWCQVPQLVLVLVLVLVSTAFAVGCEATEDPAEDEAATIAACDPLSGGELAVEYFGRLEDDRRVLVVRPDQDWDYEDFRVFLGPPERVLEHPVANVARAKDGGSTTIALTIDGDPATLDFPIVSTDAGFEPGPAMLEQRNDRFAIELVRDPKPSELDELEYFCRGGAAIGVDSPGGY